MRRTTAVCKRSSEGKGSVQRGTAKEDLGEGRSANGRVAHKIREADASATIVEIDTEHKMVRGGGNPKGQVNKWVKPRSS